MRTPCQGPTKTSYLLGIPSANAFGQQSKGPVYKEHAFALELGACMETFPVRCLAELRETVIDGPDYCEAFVHKTASFSLNAYKLDDEYFRGATITIRGDRDSSASVTLPR